MIAALLFILPAVGLVLLPAAAEASDSPLASEARSSVTPLAALGPPPVPADNPITADKVELGKLLFFDPRLSGDVSLSCATCHDPAIGWQDGAEVCRGYPGTSHWRNCQSIVNSAYYSKLFWAGSAKSLEAQAPSAARGGVAGNGERDVMEERLRQIPEYNKRFKEVFGSQRPELPDAWKAIAAFERTLVQRDTPFDLYMLGDKDALGPAELRGKDLFEGKARCIECHDGALFSNEKYYNLGVPPSEIFEDDPLKQITFRFEQYAKGVSEDLYRRTKIDLGLYYRTKQEHDIAKFRVPTLRYLTFTPPYMHNGVFFTLEEVIDFYDQGGGKDHAKMLTGTATKTPVLRPLGLNDDEKQDLIAFLESLTGEELTMEPPELPRYGVFE